MKHAGADTLDALEPLLVQLRRIPGLREKQRGIFYLRASAFLHFHEDPAGCFADLKIAGDFQRFAVHTAAQRTALTAAASAAAAAMQKR